MPGGVSNPYRSKEMKITIAYDNETKKPELRADWGFSCLIEAQDSPQILFDTGASGSILLHNLRELKFNPSDIGIVVISHPHGDHTGGLKDVMEASPDAELYLPPSFKGGVYAKLVTTVKEPLEIRHNIFTTGEIGGIEQSLVISSDRGLLVIVGCSHPGVGNILDAATRFGRVYGIIGGFHSFSNLDRLKPLSLICPCHCTQYKSAIRNLFPDRCWDCGAGAILEL